MALEFIVQASPDLIETIANRVIEITQPEFFESQKPTFTVKQAAERAKNTPQTIIKHIKKELLIANKVGKSYVIKEEHLNNYIDGK